MGWVDKKWHGCIMQLILLLILVALIPAESIAHEITTEHTHGSSLLNTQLPVPIAIPINNQKMSQKNSATGTTMPPALPSSNPTIASVTGLSSSVSIPSTHEMAAALAALPPPPPPVKDTGLALKSATDSIHAAETPAEKHQEEISEAEAVAEEEIEDALSDEEEEEAIEEEPQPVGSPLITPDEADRIHAEQLAHETHLAQHAADPHELSEAEAEHAGHEHSTHEVHAVAVHDGIHTTTAEHPIPKPMSTPPNIATSAPVAAGVNLATADHPSTLAGTNTPSTSTPAVGTDMRSTARLLLRRLAAERVAKAKKAVRDALLRKKALEQAAERNLQLPSQTHLPSPPVTPPLPTHQQDLFSIDHSHDDEPDDDHSRDSSLLKYAMKQLAEESRKKQNEVNELLAALSSEDHQAQIPVAPVDPPQHTQHFLQHQQVSRILNDDPVLESEFKEWEEIRELKKEAQAAAAAAAAGGTGFNYTLWILLGIGLLCLCIAIPIVWIYWLRTWLSHNYQPLPSSNTSYHRSINHLNGTIGIVPSTIPEVDDEYEEDELPVDSPYGQHPNRAPIRFDSRGSKSSSVHVSSPRKSSKSKYSSSSSKRSHRSESPSSSSSESDSDDRDRRRSKQERSSERHSDRDRKREKDRAPRPSVPRIEDLPDDEDFTEEQDMLASAQAKQYHSDI